MKLFDKYRSVKEMLSEADPKFLQEKFPHGKPQTRRDLIKSGALSFAASLTLPSLAETIFKPTYAEAAACSDAPAFVGLKLSGGASMMQNVVVLAEDRQLFTRSQKGESYARLGLGDGSQIANFLQKVGGHNFYIGGGFFQGIMATATPQTLAKVTCLTIPCVSGDDSSNNPFDITHFVTRAGIKGRILGGLGSRQSVTGSGQTPALGRSPNTPLAVSRVTDIANALALRGSLTAIGDKSKVLGLFNLKSALSEQHVDRLVSSANTPAGSDEAGVLVGKATDVNNGLLAATNLGVDPLTDASVSAQFNTTWRTAGNANLTAQQENSQNRVFSAMVYNALKGNAGTVNLEMGGFDYHLQGRATEQSRNIAAGRVIGQILESAVIMNRPVFLKITSDGAVGYPASYTLTNTQNDPGPTGDRGNGGCIIVFAFHPLRAPVAENKRGVVDHQIGHVAGDGSAATTFMTGGNPALAAMAAFANYLSMSGRAGEFSSFVGSLWNKDQLEEVIRLRG
jgi:hypothetical protein